MCIVRDDKKSERMQKLCTAASSFLWLLLCVVKDEYIIFIYGVVNIFKCTYSTRSHIFHRWKWMRGFLCHFLFHFVCCCLVLLCFALLSVWFGFSGTWRYNAVDFLSFIFNHLREAGSMAASADYVLVFFSPFNFSMSSFCWWLFLFCLLLTVPFFLCSVSRLFTFVSIT